MAADGFRSHRLDSNCAYDVSAASCVIDTSVRYIMSDARLGPIPDVVEGALSCRTCLATHLVAQSHEQLPQSVLPLTTPIRIARRILVEWFVTGIQQSESSRL